MRRYYFDHNATTPVSAEVLETLGPCLAEVYGNASSIHHFGQAAKQRLEQARRQVAHLLNAKPPEIVFVSGGTEADNLALLGVVRPCAGRHVVTSTIEHPAVLNACAQIEREGGSVTYVPVGSSGVVDPAAVAAAIRRETVLISVMHVNNEIGTIQPVEEIARAAHTAGVLFHSDGVQAAGKLETDVRKLDVDLYSISGHKLNAPKGAGALFVRKGTALGSLFYGGRHERERRPGTENVPGIAALGRACAWCAESRLAEAPRLAALRDRLEQGILRRVPAVAVNGDRIRRTPNTTNLCFAAIEGEAMVIALDLRGFAVSSGAACSSGSIEPSHVLTAIGLRREQARSSLRFSLGRGNTAEQVDDLIEAVADAAAHLRRISVETPAHAR